MEAFLMALLRPFLLLALCIVALLFRLRAERMRDTPLKRVLLWRLDPGRRGEQLFQRLDAWIGQRLGAVLKKGIHLVRGR